MKKNKFVIDCGICGKHLVETRNQKATVLGLARKYKLKRINIQVFEGTKVIASEEFFICDNCLGIYNFPHILQHKLKILKRSRG